MVKSLKINKFIMLRLSEAMKNEVMRIKIVFWYTYLTKFLRRTLGFLIF